MSSDTVQSTIDLIDTHCHLTFDGLSARLDEVTSAAASVGVRRMITIGCTAAEIPAVEAIAAKYLGVFAACGIHPHEARNAGDEAMTKLEAAWGGGRMVACGEIGLDYHYDFSPRDVQQAVFRRQLDLAAARDLPVVIHCREAHEDVVRLLLAHGYANRRVVFHCFSGTADEAAELRSHGWWTSFTGIVTFKKADEQRAALLATPEDQLLFETDSPYLTPEPIRNRRPNEPQYLPHTVRFAAELRGASFEALAAATTANAERFFGL